MVEYKKRVDSASRNVQEAKEIFLQTSLDWDDDWCLGKFDAILDLLDIVRGFLDGYSENR